LLGLLAVIAVLLLQQPPRHHTSDEDDFLYQQGPVGEPDPRVPKLYDAVCRNDYRAVVFYVSGGVNGNMTYGGYDYPILYYAIKNHNLRITKYLIDHNISTEPVPCQRDVDLFYEAGKEHNFALFDIVASSSYTEALCQIVKYDDVELVKYLLHKGADVNGYRCTCRSPLHIAKSAAVVKVLLEYKAKAKETGILYIDYKGPHYGTYMVELAANVDITDEYGDTPLHYAVKDKRVDLIKLLLMHQAKYDLANEKGITALDLAKKNGLAHLFPTQH
jgi:ankyrin repeat protein